MVLNDFSVQTILGHGSKIFNNNNNKYSHLSVDLSCILELLSDYSELVPSINVVKTL